MFFRLTLHFKDYLWRISFIIFYRYVTMIHYILNTVQCLKDVWHTRRFGSLLYSRLPVVSYYYTDSILFYLKVSCGGYDQTRS
jgi:hypothetical protein